MSQNNVVIVVEDEPVHILALERMLREAGYEAHFAEDVEGAERLMYEIPADILITDIRMPRRYNGEYVKDGGIEVAGKFNAINPYGFIIFCANLDPLCYASGSKMKFRYEYLPKPFTDTQLFMKLGRTDLVKS